MYGKGFKRSGGFMITLNMSQENINLLYRQFEIAAVVKCHHCKRYKWQDGEWRNRPETLLIEGTYGNLSFGTCPECIDDLYEEI
jgi:hypothetical protein